MGLTAVGAALAALEAIIDSAAAADGCKTGCAMRVSNLFKILKYGEKVRRGESGDHAERFSSWVRRP